jgi:peptidoglycan biosynthesis protein MviN/MurJ (putative lipid II flippase)
MQQVVMMSIVAGAGRLTTGAVTALTFAYNLVGVPLSLLGASYSIASFPLLARSSAEGDLEKFRLTLLSSLTRVLFWSLLATALMISLGEVAIRILFGTGAFDLFATEQTSILFAIFALSLMGQALGMLCIRAWYAQGYTRIPFVAQAWGAGVTIALAVISFSPWGISLVREWSANPFFHTGMLVGFFGVGVYVSFGILLFKMHMLVRGVVHELVRVSIPACVSACVAGGVAWSVYHASSALGETLLSLVVRAGGALVLAVCIWAGMVWWYRKTVF